jgi:Tol biopolymer transport system component
MTGLAKSLSKHGRGKIMIVFFLSILGIQDLHGQYFGRNKPKYKKDVATLMESPHFQIYHYLENDSTARKLALWHEWWYERHKTILKDTFRTKNPVIFYNHHADFQQTTAIESHIEIGTGGVTESLKNRVVMPYMETHAQTSHVIGHEMVHAFQYRLLSHNDSLGLGTIRNIPLWMVEGMAEYLSLGRKHSHTAMWMRDAVLNEKIPTLKQMSEGYRFFPYRYGHAFWAYVTGIWGEDIIQPLFINSAAYGYERALEKVLLLDEEIISKTWAQQLRVHYAPYMADTTGPIGREWFHPANAGNLNLSPVYSPDAKYLAFVSEKELISVDIFLVETASGRVVRKLSAGLDDFHIDDFNFIESVGTFSPDSRQFAYTVYSKGKNRILVVDVQRGRKVREIEIPGLDAFNHINWSPNGRHFIMSGMKDGKSDLYLYDLENAQLMAITDDHFSYVQPAWSPDGNWIVFSSDKGGKNDPEKFRFEGFNLFLIDLNSMETKDLNIFPGGENLNPQFSMDGNSIYFLSDAEGFRDLYEYNLINKEIFRLTRFFTGISGITPMAPALTVARDNGSFAYSIFRNGKYTIFQADPADFYATTRILESDSLDKRAATLPPFPGEPSLLTDQQLDSIAYELERAIGNEIGPKPYRHQFQLDYLGNTGMITLVSGRYASGFSGGINALFSDMLGNHQLFSAISLHGEIFDLSTQLAYINRKNPIYWGTIFSHIPYQSATSSIFPDSVVFRDQTVSVTNMAIDFLRIFETRFGTFAFYPLSKTHRLEAGTSVTRYNFRVDRINNYYYQGSFIGESRKKQPSPPGFFLGQANLAYVGDNSIFGVVGPLRGKRFRLDAEKYFGSSNFYTFLADYRQYIRMKPITIAFRAFHYGRYGHDEHDRLLAPLFLGQPTLVRGFMGNSFNRNDVNIFGDFYLNQLIGNRLLVGNMEVRLPFSGPERLSLIKSHYFPTELALFLDTGLAWDRRGLVNQPISEETDRVPTRNPIASAGLSFRVNIMGYLVVESYYAVPWQRNLEYGVFGLNFTPSW